MRKISNIFLILLIACGVSLFAAEVDKFSKENYPFKAHDKLHFDCKSCHKEQNPKEYKSLTTDDCLSCHKSYKKLAEQTGHLGYDDNIHASPHYPNMDCNLCHQTHKPSKNYCVMCHSQDSMKKLLVP
ncbi:cytochrome c3 family protein [Campylobacter pinnipediorum]|uniref:Fumarate reductase n=1 Tax=Campylobacter pinnipediorum subsp. pinnipediorum TaxID=1660067 RepID=A0AAX0LCF7_9BACT|nr:cytochrome c3 family protein [Campylobacter pinnipediorum]AQW81438.1 cytochrome c3 [Campylobacter pinnipediorum subsp. pinnipediorum]AQW83066.1 cytochrome c3 [Campylobacter pinnipediorum subsp. pinnipediorum]AQW84634.1 cytochrome c3 [Campylobacter pinnipediorum subsp. pinnipediorum]OPA81892.1 fumarate reductase [Campylobacter pinnipediorum subsp. pinnipediorum]